MFVTNEKAMHQDFVKHFGPGSFMVEGLCKLGVLEVIDYFGLSAC